MTLFFWITAVGLSLLAAVFVAGPLLFRSTGTRDRTRVNVELYEDRIAELEQALDDAEIDKAEFETLKAELQKNLLAETQDATSRVSASTGSRLPVAVAVAIPVLAFPLYFLWGSFVDVQLTRQLQTLDPANEMEVRGTIDALARRMASQPENDQGWFLLANAYVGLEEYARAAAAFRHLVERFPDDVNLSSNLAEALYLSRGGEMTDEVRAAVDRALELDPKNLAMLELLGMHSFRSNELAAALGYFERALDAGPTGERAQVIQRAIVGVRGMMQERGETPPDVAGTLTEDMRSIVVALTAVEEGIPDEATVFVFARAVAGPPMPLAVQRLKYGDLPASIRLDESMAMLQGVGLGNFDQVQVVARVALDGDARGTPEIEVVSSELDLAVGNPSIAIELKKGAAQASSGNEAPAPQG